MALLGNHSIILKNPATFIGGTQVSNVRSAFNATGQLRGRYYGSNDSGLPLTASLGSGTRPPYSILLAYKAGELSSTTYTSSSATASGQTGYNISGTANVSVSASAGLALVVNLASTVSISVVPTANLIGLGNLSGNAYVSVVAEALGVSLGNMSSDVEILVTADATLTGLGNMSSTVYLNQSEATVQQIVDAVMELIESGETGGGASAEAIWDYAERSLTSNPDLLNTETGDVIVPID